MEPGTTSESHRSKEAILRVAFDASLTPSAKERCSALLARLMPRVPAVTRLSVFAGGEEVYWGPCPGSSLAYCCHIAPCVTSARSARLIDADRTMTRLSRQCRVCPVPTAIVHFSPFDLDPLPDEGIKAVIRASVDLAANRSVKAVTVVGELAFDMPWVDWVLSDILKRKLSVLGYLTSGPTDLADSMRRLHE